jgi:hypothetical protein
VVEDLGAGPAPDLDLVLRADQPVDPAADPDAVAELGGDGVDVGAGAAGDGHPLGPVAQVEQAVVVEEGQQRSQRVAIEGRGLGRPDGGAEGHEVEVDEGVGQPVLGHEVGEGAEVVAVGALGQTALPGPAEAHDVGDHPQEGRTHEVGPLGEHAVEVGARPLETRPLARHAEGHVAGLGGHTQLVEQAQEVGVRPVVADDEPGVDGVVARGEGHVEGVRVPAGAAVGLEQHDLVLGGEQPGRDESRDAGTGDGDPHGGWPP